MTGAITYPQSYIKQCFNVWYLAGRPNGILRLKEIIPEFDGHKPSKAQLKRWMIDGMWDEWADDMDSKAMVLSHEGLINKKAKLLMKQQKDAEKLAEKALKYLTDTGFDSSSAAVNAYFKATEEQRKAEGFSDLLEKMDKLSNNDVERMIIEKLSRILENDQIIDSEEIPELLSGDEETESLE